MTLVSGMEFPAVKRAPSAGFGPDCFRAAWRWDFEEEDDDLPRQGKGVWDFFRSVISKKSLAQGGRATVVAPPVAVAPTPKT